MLGDPEVEVVAAPERESARKRAVRHRYLQVGARGLEGCQIGIMLKHEIQFVSYQRDIITAEAKSQSSLARNWRPITMLTFVAIILNNFLVFPYIDLFFPGKAVQLPIPPDMWNLLKLGITGYILGRSAEKGIESWKKKEK